MSREPTPDFSWRAERLLVWFHIIGGGIGYLVTWDDAGTAPHLNHTLDQAVNLGIGAIGVASYFVFRRVRAGRKFMIASAILLALDLVLLGAIKPINAHWLVVTPQPGLLLPLIGAMRFGTRGAAIGSVGLVVSQTLFEVFRSNVWGLPADIDNSIILVMVAVLGGFMVGRVVVDARQVVQEQSDRASAEEDMSARLQALDRRKNAFVNITSHELRTPVAILLSGATLLKDSTDLGPERVGAMLDSMQRSAERLAELSDELTLIASFDAQTIVAKDILVDLAPILLDRAEDDCDFTTVHVPARVRGDRDLIINIIETLLSNARAHGAPPIQIWWEQAGGDIVLHVHDNGPGIDEAHRETVFDRFNVVDDLAHYIGSGLGLAIARGLAEIMEGRLEMAPPDQPGYGARGAHFLLWLPAVDALPDEDDLASDPAAEAAIG